MKYEITKGSEKDFEGTPEWALVVFKNNSSIIYADSFSKGARWGQEDWQSITPLDQLMVGASLIAERRPITEPVGVECEFASHSLPDYWHSGIVRYLSDHTIVIKLTDLVNGKAESVSHPLTMKFRPIRSPEDVAREKITLNMLQYMYSSDEDDHAQVCKIYDAIAAGKILGVKLEGK